MAGVGGGHSDRIARVEGSAIEVLGAFASLGVRCFGGPVAHLGYFRAEFVARRGWLSEQAFADLVALCQFLPGPASSQTGFAIGLLRAGLPGGLAAWAGFTLPSAALMVLFAFGAGRVAGSALGAGLLHGLKLVAVAVVAQAVWGMARSFCPDRARASIAALSAILVLSAPGAAGQLGAIALGAVTGLVFCRGLGARETKGSDVLDVRVSRRVAGLCLAGFAGLLVLSPLLSHAGGTAAAFGAFYRAGSLVFGGGHVVLPLLRDTVVRPGWVAENLFLAGYGAAQAMPGPLFTFAAFLGAVLKPPDGGLPGAVVGLIAIFLPGLLLLTGTLPFWARLRAVPSAQAAMRGVNAAVVGVLGAALYNPVWTSAVYGPGDFASALAGVVLLVAWRAPPLLVVCLGAGAGVSGL